MGGTRKAASIMENEPFAVNLRKLMQKHGENQKALASELEVKQQTISYYRNGQSLPDVANLVKIARHYGVSTDYLLGLSDYPNYEDRGTTAESLGFSPEVQNKLIFLQKAAKKEKNVLSLIDTINAFFECRESMILFYSIDALKKNVIESRDLLSQALVTKKELETNSSDDFKDYCDKINYCIRRIEKNHKFLRYLTVEQFEKTIDLAFANDDYDQYVCHEFDKINFAYNMGQAESAAIDLGEHEIAAFLKECALGNEGEYNGEHSNN